jgi:inner membrane protein
MEPVTHFLTGACIGRAGFNRLTAYATLAVTLAAEAPDLDVLWGLAGPVVGFAHHRGITHTFLAAPFIALAATGAVWLVDRFAHRFLPHRKKADAQPIRWLWVWFAAFVADLSHLLLDWTNNYGLRPFFPFNAHWYSGDLVFIAEPIIWALLLSALIFPALLRLTDREVGARRVQFRGRGWAIFALTGMVLLWCWRWAEHAEGLNLVANSSVAPTDVKRIALEPYPFNPWRWHALLETDTTFQTAEVDTRRGLVESDPQINAIFKPPATAATQVARQTRLGQVYLDWSQWPVVRDLGPQSVPGNPPPDIPPSRTFTTVEFSDLRFAYAFNHISMTGSSEQSLEQMLNRAALSGWVYVVDGKEDAGQFMNGREQK